MTFIGYTASMYMWCYHIHILLVSGTLFSCHFWTGLDKSWQEDGPWDLKTAKSPSDGNDIPSSYRLISARTPQSLCDSMIKALVGIYNRYTFIREGFLNLKGVCEGGSLIKFLSAQMFTASTDSF